VKAEPEFPLPARAGPAIPLLRADAPVLVFGGCYSNLEATQAMRAEAGRLGIPPERILCTGDVAAYCADAAATVAAIRDWGVHVVMGNCEESLGWEQEDCGCGFAAGSACERASAAWYAHANGQLQPVHRAWMRSLPRRIDLELGGRRLAAVHGSVDQINRFVFASTPWEEKERQMDLAGCDGVIGGHCGLPFTHCAATNSAATNGTATNGAAGRVWHNSGAIGMPANDGTARVWYSLLLPAAGGIEFRARALEYDAERAAGKMLAAGLPQDYAQALTTGLWPSCDVLPAPELARRGRPLSEDSVLWRAAPPAGPADRTAAADRGRDA
jgi:hypothetical protein